MTRHAWLALLVMSGCGGVITLGDDDGGQTGGGSGGAGGGNVVAADGGFDGLPCDVATVLATSCVKCHGPQLTGAAPWPLISRAQLLEAAPGYPGQTKAQRSLARMQMTSAPMPPFPDSPVSAAGVAAFQAWVNAGEPLGSCGTVATPDAGPVPTTCASNKPWNGARDENMRPGEACVACHQSQEPGKAYFFMGTLFPSAHERNDCDALPPSQTRVEILDVNNTVVLTMTPFSPSGNFYYPNRKAIGQNGKNILMPYRARVVRADGGVSLMMTPQTNGDCNSCHTEQGASGAPGRIVWPP